MSDCLFLLLKYVFSYMKESYFVACFIHSCVELWFVAEMIFGDCRWHQKDAQRIVVMSNSIKSILKLSWKFIQDKVRKPGLEKPVIYRVNFYKTCYLVYSCTNYNLHMEIDYLAKHSSSECLCSYFATKTYSALKGKCNKNFWFFLLDFSTLF